MFYGVQACRRVLRVAHVQCCADLAITIMLWYDAMNIFYSDGNKTIPGVNLNECHVCGVYG